MDGLAEDQFCRFRPPKSVQEEDSLLVQSKPKSTRYKDKWAVEVFRTWQAAREPKFCILDPGRMFKEYDLQRIQSLEDKLEDLDSLSLNYWLPNLSKKLPIRTVVGFDLHCKRKCTANNRSNKALLKLCIAFSY